MFPVYSVTNVPGLYHERANRRLHSSAARSEEHCAVAGEPRSLDCLSTNNLMGLEIRQATAADVDTVSSILLEAANWLKDRDMPMWRVNELLPERVADDVRDGLFFLGDSSGEPGRHDQVSALGPGILAGRSRT
jgi:hypothetical protein